MIIKVLSLNHWVTNHIKANVIVLVNSEKKKKISNGFCL